MSDESIAEQEAELLAELDALRAENERLREQIYLADGILGSEPMIWLVTGSNHPKAHWLAVSPAIHVYWKKYGNAFRPEATEPLTDDDRVRDNKEFLATVKRIIDRDQEILDRLA